jgi:cytochrome oxidase Cu insertion factor (SCO1/SenC/PrrC family)
MKAAAALIAAVLAIGAVAWFFFPRSVPPPEDRRAGAARLMNELMSGKVPVGGPFTLTDAAGSSRSLADFRGKVVLLYFGFLSCPDICPTDLLAIGKAIESLGAQGGQVQPLFITLDPERDTRDALRGYVASFHPRFVALTGSEADVRRVATAYKVFFERVQLPGTASYTIDHAAFTFVLDREGKYVGLFPPGTPTERMLVMLREQLS